MDNPNLPEDYDETIEENYSEINSFESAILEMQQKEEREVKKAKPLKLRIHKKGTYWSEEWNKLYPKWYLIDKCILYPNSIKSERALCWTLLTKYGVGEYWIQTWNNKTLFDIQFKIKSNTKKRKGKKVFFFTFWKGEVNEQYFQRFGGNLLGYLHSALPVFQRHLWINV